MVNFLQTLILRLTLTTAFSLWFSISAGFLFAVEAGQIPDTTDTGDAAQISDGTDLVFDDKPSGEASDRKGPVASFLTSYVFEPMRLTLMHEVSCKIKDPDGIKNNRSLVRLEYAKLFLNNFHLQLDSKMTAFWSNDHRSEAEGKKVLFETSTREAFLQGSFGGTSIKAGIQILIWGESDGGAITDVISPRDYSESFFINLEDSRIGQPMLILDQFSPIGDWELFFVADPRFNKYPEKGTAYYFDPYNGMAEYQDKTAYKNLFEYGGRWKKTFGKSDFSFMGASLIDNDYAYRSDGLTSDNKYLETKVRQRFTLAGTTFNYAIGSFLYRGEFGWKSPKDFNDAYGQIVKKSEVDSSLVLEYSPGGTFSSSLEAVNNHVVDWNDEIQGVPENTNSLVICLGDKFLNDDLYLHWMTTYSRPYTSFLHILTTSYKWNDNVTFYFNAYYSDIKDERSGYWIYRDLKQFAFKIQYQF